MIRMGEEKLAKRGDAHERKVRGRKKTIEK